MGLKGNSLFGNALVYTHAVYLIAPAISEQGIIPVHKGVETTQGLNQFMPGPQREVIGIGENNGGDLAGGAGGVPGGRLIGGNGGLLPTLTEMS